MIFNWWKEHKWKNFNSAPKDGTPIIATGFFGVGVIHFSTKRGKWVLSNGSQTEVVGEISRWQELPKF